jgi:excisionase family DNA binding protein
VNPIAFFQRPNRKDDMETAVLTIDQAADYLQVPVTTMRAWRAKGYGPPGFLLGKHLRYRRVDVDAWLQAESTAQTANPA